ncbi:MAG: hypothetical protein IJR17_07540 [Clostridia bacterium]|nr:hypothetical protein [Clostridia bacterium]
MKRLLCLMLMGCQLLLTGCLQGAPLDSFCYVLDIGVERGENLPYRFVFLLNRDAGEEEGRGNTTLVQAEERSLFDAIEALSGTLPAQLSFERTTLMAFSRDLAEAGEIRAITDGALGRLKIRHNIRVIVVETDMEETFLGLISNDDPSLNRLKSNVKRYERNYGFVEDWGLNRMLEAFKNETGDALLPYCGKNDGLPRADMAGGQAYPYLGGRLLGEGQLGSTLCGSAVFAQDRMVGLLSGQHTMLVLMAKGTFFQGHAQIPFRGETVNVALYALKKPRRRMEGNTFYCTLTLEADVEQPLQVDAPSGELIEAIRTHLQGELCRVFEATKAAGADVFCLGEEAIGSFQTTKAWEAYAFSSHLQQMEAAFDVNVKLSHAPKDPALE